MLNIDIEKAQKINMSRVWAQACQLFKDGFRYWFTLDEIEQLHRENGSFQVISNEEQLLIKYFEKPESRADATDFMQPAEILSYIAFRSSGIKINSKRLWDALAKHGFEKWHKTDSGIQKWVYSVTQKTEFQ